MTKSEELIYTKGIEEGINRVREKYLDYFNHSVPALGSGGSYKEIKGAVLEEMTSILAREVQEREHNLIQQIKDEDPAVMFEKEIINGMIIDDSEMVLDIANQVESAERVKFPLEFDDAD